MEVRVSKLRTVRLLIPALVLAAATGSPLAGMHGGAVQAAPAGPSGGTGAAEAAARRDVPSAAGAEAGGPVVLELFTSQGCSTCPPADRLLSELGRDGSAGQLVPIAFHVDYWDRLGWSDPFSSSRWSQRQQQYAHTLSGDRLATPHLVIDGRSQTVGPQRDGGRAQMAAGRAQRPAAAVDLAMDAPSRGGARARLRVKVSVRVLEQTASRDLDLWVALTQSGLVTAVKGGENAAATLHDDFVVRRLEKAFTVRGRTGEQRAKELDLTLDPSWPLADLAVAAFVQDPASLVIVGAARSPVAVQPPAQP